MLIRDRMFSGEQPKVSSRLMRDGTATLALDCDLGSGELRPIRTDRVVKDSPVRAARTLFELGGELFAWAGEVDAINTPIDTAVPRVFFTGDGYPKQAEPIELAAGTSFRMGVPAPENKVVGFITEPTDESTGIELETTYVVVFVNRWDEFGPPSIPSEPITYRRGDKLTLIFNADTDVTQDHAIYRYRLYRQEPGTANFFFVSEHGVEEGNPVDETLETSAEQLTDLINYPPPSDMEGLHLMSNDICVGFRPESNTVFVSEIGQPNAWPYSFTVTDTVVGLSSYGNTLVVLTTGRSERITIIDPARLVPVRSTRRDPCVSRRGILQVDGGVAWPTPDGLAFTGRGGEDLLTKDTHDDRDWNALQPETFRAVQRDGQYLAFYGPDNATGGGWIYDFRERNATIRRLSARASAVTNVAGTDTILCVRGGDIIELEGGQENKLYRWERSLAGEGSPFAITSRGIRSQELYENPRPRELIRIRAAEAAVTAEREERMTALYTTRGLGGAVSARPVADVSVAGNEVGRSPAPLDVPYVTLTIYGDEQLVDRETVASQEEGRVRRSDRHRLWRYTLEGNAVVTQVELAGSFSEFHTGN